MVVRRATNPEVVVVEFRHSGSVNGLAFGVLVRLRGPGAKRTYCKWAQQPTRRPQAAPRFVQRHERGDRRRFGAALRRPTGGPITERARDGQPWSYAATDV